MPSQMYSQFSYHDFPLEEGSSLNSRYSIEADTTAQMSFADNKTTRNGKSNEITRSHSTRRVYEAYKSWLKSNYWTKLGLDATQIEWRCVRFLQPNILVPFTDSRRTAV
jgi:hypothetical protein